MSRSGTQPESGTGEPLSLRYFIDNSYRLVDPRIADFMRLLMWLLPYALVWRLINRYTLGSERIRGVLKALVVVLAIWRSWSYLDAQRYIRQLADAKHHPPVANRWHRIRHRPQPGGGDLPVVVRDVRAACPAPDPARA